ncbi:hypothetical protein M3221_07010 [Domibacillus indicus]|uniref:hypothetical protein n=1 Tax=Domibacillus indicus TaxID=1437523 RepID=UPI00203D87D3|nr:hypothetical protein [Domibacillus indicus]MCM3788149.1 hypothetical protein [Domibacillus indicus]
MTGSKAEMDTPLTCFARGWTAFHEIIKQVNRFYEKELYEPVGVYKIKCLDGKPGGKGPGVYVFTVPSMLLQM